MPSSIRGVRSNTQAGTGGQGVFIASAAFVTVQYNCSHFVLRHDTLFLTVAFAHVTHDLHVEQELCIIYIVGTKYCVML